MTELVVLSSFKHDNVSWIHKFHKCDNEDLRATLAIPSCDRITTLVQIRTQGPSQNSQRWRRFCICRFMQTAEGPHVGTLDYTSGYSYDMRSVAVLFYYSFLSLTEKVTTKGLTKLPHEPKKVEVVYRFVVSHLTRGQNCTTFSFTHQCIYTVSQ